jgi:hypothetical protein
MRFRDKRCKMQPLLHFATIYFAHAETFSNVCTAIRPCGAMAKKGPLLLASNGTVGWTRVKRQIRLRLSSQA